MICLDTIVQDKSMHLECNHVFHTACMLKYISYSKGSVACPICRKQILNMPQDTQYSEITVQPMFPDSVVTSQHRTDRTARILSGISILVLFGFFLYAGSSH
jgi:hypothetical protein